MSEAIRVLQREHSNMNKVLAVLDAEMKVLQELGKVDPDLMSAIVEYIESFPNEVHHPKEERYIFAPLRERNPQAVPLVDELTREHHDEAQMVANLKAAIEAVSLEVPVNKPDIEKHVAAYTAFAREHMRKEETLLFPMALASLRPKDWRAIDKEFVEHKDPLFDERAHEHYAKVLRHIIYLSLPPPDSQP